jgi:hypothetical protein
VALGKASYFLKEAVAFGADLVGVLGATGIVYAIAYPETVNTYLQRISTDVSSISESIPLWPVIEQASYSHDIPRFSGFSMQISNPKNIIVEDFAVFGEIQFAESKQQFSFTAPNLVPPNEYINVKANIIREPWFPKFSDLSSALVTICFQGVLEGEAENFVENRVYSVGPQNASLTLKNREFSLGAFANCDVN